ncbi:HD domain-containing protein [Psychrobacter pygoscelis]|uniref:HD domain-containing protein n=1 Tax=Psychrobacter pygoscelis TaxID=2488563 RepID=UPI001A954BBE|nr:HD domain-containing protein [Psychrobacter pygoscelis]
MDSQRQSKSTAPDNLPKMEDITHFLLELDALKHVERRNYITGGTRRENSAEHSWHLAMACWSIAEYFKLPLNHERLLKMALVHDLGEIDAGDTYLYDSQRSEAHHTEREGIHRLQDERGNGIDNLAKIWEEQETGSSQETQLVKVVDRLLPFLLNLKTQGGMWQMHQVTRSQVLSTQAFIKKSFPDIYDWLIQQIDVAVEQGWLIDA